MGLAGLSSFSPPADLAGQLPLGPHLQDLFTGHRFSRPVRQGSVEPESDCSQTVSPETLCSSLCSLEDGLLGSPARLASQLLGDELLQTAAGEGVLCAHVHRPWEAVARSAAGTRPPSCAAPWPSL